MHTVPSILSRRAPAGLGGLPLPQVDTWLKAAEAAGQQFPVKGDPALWPPGDAQMTEPSAEAGGAVTGRRPGDRASPWEIVSSPTP